MLVMWSANLHLSYNYKAEPNLTRVSSKPTNVWQRILPAQALQYAPVAQMEEHVTFNHGVRGSSPLWRTINISKGENK